MNSSKNFVLIELVGGLGNQMFQFAVAKIIAEKNKADVKVDTAFYRDDNKNFPRHFSLEIFDESIIIGNETDISYFFWLSNLDNLKKNMGLSYPRIFNETSFNFDPKVLALEAPVYLKGYFQSSKYFVGKEKFIREFYKFPLKDLGGKNEEIRHEIVSNIYVSVHIRRGDYVKDIKTQEFHGNCNISYFKRSIEYFSSFLSNFKLIFFSDDINWVKEEFKEYPFDKIYVSGNTGLNSWKDMYLMSLCDHNIIANSSFSWWAAWLNNNPDKKIVAPIKWFSDVEQEKNSVGLIPKEWIRL